MRTYVINLARETERRAQMESQLRDSGLHYEFVQGVDGQRLSVAERADLVDEAAVARFPDWLTAGMIGCMLSHNRVYHLITEAEEGAALVLEDDALLSSNLAALVAEMLALVPDDGVVLLNFRTHRPCRLARSGTKLASGHELFHPLDHWQPLSGLAYMVGQQAAAAMAQASLPVRWAPDSWGDYVEAGVLASIQCVLPRPVMPSLTVRSSTRNDGTSLDRRQRLLERSPIRLVRQVNRRRVAWLSNRVEIVE